MKKKTKYMIVGLVCFGLVAFGLGKGIPAYKKHVLVQHLKSEIKQSAGLAVDSYYSYIAEDSRRYDEGLLACELHHLAMLMLQLEDIKEDYEWSGSNEIRLAREAVLLYGEEAENKEYLLNGLKALEENVESDGHGWFLNFYNTNTQ